MASLNESSISLPSAESFTDLSEKDRAFAVEYVTNGFKHNDAAQAVGLARTTGLSKVRNPLVAAFISHLQASSANALLITKQFVETKYLEVLPKLMGEEEVPMFNHQEGTTVQAKKFHSAEVVSVLRDLGKAAGYVAPDGPKTGAVNVQINMGGFVGEPEVVIEHEPLEEEDDE